MASRRTRSHSQLRVVQVELKEIPIYGEWIGTLNGLVDADAFMALPARETDRLVMVSVGQS